MISSTFPIILQATAIATLALAAKADIRERIIPNRLVLIVLTIGAALRLLTAPELIAISLAITTVLFFLLGVLGHFGVVGGGDVKMISAATLLVSPERVFPLMIAIAIAGGVLSAVYFAARWSLGKSEFATAQASNLQTGSTRPGLFGREAANIRSGEPMPYGVAIFAGVVFCIASEVI